MRIKWYRVGMSLRVTKGDEDARGARTPAGRVHTPVNALRIVSATLCSHECVRHNVLNGVGALDTRSLLCIR